MRPTTSPASAPRRAYSALLLIGVLVSGCLPSSQKQNTRAVTPADSASAALAETAPVADLELVWTSPLGEVAFHPTGLAWLRPDSADARLAVVETRDGAIHLLSARGEPEGVWDVTGEYPYLAGAWGDTLAVLARGSGRLDWITEAGTVASVNVPEDASAAFADGARTLVRVGGTTSDTPAALVALDADGTETARYPIAVGWRASGYVRPWGNAVLALSGYRPVVDVWTPTSEPGATLDTLALTGFASPQLVRSYQYMTGEVDEPPLLTSAAAALGDELYVLNVRTERVRVDVYGRDGRLRRVLQGPVPTDAEGREAVLDVYPVDLAVRATEAGVEIAVLLQRPRGILQSQDSRVVLFRVPPPEAASPVSDSLASRP